MNSTIETEQFERLTVGHQKPKPFKRRPPPARPVTQKQRYVCGIHEAGHAVAACVMGFGMTRRGIVLNGRGGIAYTRGPGIRSQNPKIRESYNRRRLVTTLAGPVAEYRVNKGLVRIDRDVEDIAFALRELVPSKKRYLNKVIENMDGGEFWALIWTLAAHPRRKQALAELDELPMLGIPPIDTSFFEVLWPFAQQARAIIDLHWPSIEQISRHLVKVGSMRGDEIEALC